MTATMLQRRQVDEEKMSRLHELQEKALSARSHKDMPLIIRRRTDDIDLKSRPRDKETDDE
jgi:hypothetical protein